MSGESDVTVAGALNRIADALFQQAKASRAQVKVAERQVQIAENMAEMQRTNLAVTKHLESELALRARETAGGSA
jgi:hypothetical protein